MKTKTLLIIFAISSILSLVGQNNSPLPSRKVLPEGVKFWRECYQNLNFVPRFNSEIDPIQTFSSDSINYIYNLSEHYRDTSNLNGPSRVVFRYYLPPNTSSFAPRIAIGNSSDTTQFLISTEDGSNLILDYNELASGFKYWDEVLLSDSSNFAYVREYRYSWSSVYNSIFEVKEGEAYGNFLRLEHVVHTVSPLDTNYQIYGSLEYEGYVAFDIIIWKKNLMQGELLIASKEDDYDFAVPCPKNCSK